MVREEHEFKFKPTEYKPAARYPSESLLQSIGNLNLKPIGQARTLGEQQSFRNQF